MAFDPDAWRRKCHAMTAPRRTFIKIMKGSGYEIPAAEKEFDRLLNLGKIVKIPVGLSGEAYRLL